MGQKSKAEQYGLKEIIAEKWDGGKNTVVWVTEKTNEYLQQNGFKITISREAIRRTIRNYEDEIADLRKGMEEAKVMAEVFKDRPGTEQAEANLIVLSRLISKELRTVEGLNFENPVDLILATAKLTTAQAKVSQYRTQAIKALDKAKIQITAELQKAITNDPELLERLCKIVDDVKVA
jgi:predicted ribosome quality control (RQC) complex YloA/Tae2 family protein